MIPLWLLIILNFILIPLVSPLIIGVIRRLKAILQNRQGAKIIQPYQDLWKLFHKDEVIPHDASWIFLWTPYLLFAITLLIAVGIPVLATIATFHVTGDFLVTIYLLAAGTFFLALAGIDPGSGFGGFGSSREMMIAALCEGGLIFSLLAVAVTSGTTNFSEMIEALTHESFFVSVSMLIALISFVIVAVAENSRVPVDNPATHLELTMIHEAMILEYSGKRLALIEWAAANKLLIFMTLAANLFFPWGVAQEANLWTVVGSLLLWLGKVIVLALIVAVVESSIAKLRIFRVPDLLLTSWIFGVIALGIAIL